MEDFSYLATIDSTVSQLSKLVTSTKLLSQKDEIPTLGSRILAGKFLEGMVVFGPVNPFNDFLTALERELISAIVIDKQELQCNVVKLLPPAERNVLVKLFLVMSDKYLSLLCDSSDLNLTDIGKLLIDQLSSLTSTDVLSMELIHINSGYSHNEFGLVRVALRKLAEKNVVNVIPFLQSILGCCEQLWPSLCSSILEIRCPSFQLFSYKMWLSESKSLTHFLSKAMDGSFALQMEDPLSPVFHPRIVAGGTSLGSSSSSGKSIGANGSNSNINSSVSSNSIKNNSLLNAGCFPYALKLVHGGPEILRSSCFLRKESAFIGKTSSDPFVVTNNGASIVAVAASAVDESSKNIENSVIVVEAVSQPRSIVSSSHSTLCDEKSEKCRISLKRSVQPGLFSIKDVDLVYENLANFQVIRGRPEIHSKLFSGRSSLYLWILRSNNGFNASGNQDGDILYGAWTAESSVFPPLVGWIPWSVEVDRGPPLEWCLVPTSHEDVKETIKRMQEPRESDGLVTRQQDDGTIHSTTGGDVLASDVKRSMKGRKSSCLTSFDFPPAQIVDSIVLCKDDIAKNIVSENPLQRPKKPRHGVVMQIEDSKEDFLWSRYGNEMSSPFSISDFRMEKKKDTGKNLKGLCSSSSSSSNSSSCSSSSSSSSSSNSSSSSSSSISSNSLDFKPDNVTISPISGMKRAEELESQWKSYVSYRRTKSSQRELQFSHLMSAKTTSLERLRYLETLKLSKSNIENSFDSTSVENESNNSALEKNVDPLASFKLQWSMDALLHSTRMQLKNQRNSLLPKLEEDSSSKDSSKSSLSTTCSTMSYNVDGNWNRNQDISLASISPIDSFSSANVKLEKSPQQASTILKDSVKTLEKIWNYLPGWDLLELYMAQQRLLDKNCFQMSIIGMEVSGEEVYFMAQSREFFNGSTHSLLSLPMDTSCPSTYFTSTLSGYLTHHIVEQSRRSYHNSPRSPAQHPMNVIFQDSSSSSSYYSSEVKLKSVVNYRSDSKLDPNKIISESLSDTTSSRDSKRNSDSNISGELTSLDAMIRNRWIFNGQSTWTAVQDLKAGLSTIMSNNDKKTSPSCWKVGQGRLSSSQLEEFHQQFFKLRRSFTAVLVALSSNFASLKSVCLPVMPDYPLLKSDILHAFRQEIEELEVSKTFLNPVSSLSSSTSSTTSSTTVSSTAALVTSSFSPWSSVDRLLSPLTSYATSMSSSSSSSSTSTTSNTTSSTTISSFRGILREDCKNPFKDWMIQLENYFHQVWNILTAVKEVDCEVKRLIESLKEEKEESNASIDLSRYLTLVASFEELIRKYWIPYEITQIPNNHPIHPIHPIDGVRHRHSSESMSAVDLFAFSFPEFQRIEKDFIHLSENDVLLRQNYRCRLCQSPLSSSMLGWNKNYAFCRLTGGLYCLKWCHRRERRVIPGIFISRGETVEDEVCHIGCEYLDALKEIPSLDLSNWKFSKFCGPNYRNVHDARQKLVDLCQTLLLVLPPDRLDDDSMILGNKNGHQEYWTYLQRWVDEWKLRINYQEQIREILLSFLHCDRLYMIFHPTIYSLRDLEDVLSGKLYHILQPCLTELNDLLGRITKTMLQ